MKVCGCHLHRRGECADWEDVRAGLRIQNESVEGRNWGGRGEAQEKQNPEVEDIRRAV